MKIPNLMAAAFLFAVANMAFGAEPTAVEKFRALEEVWSNAIKAQDKAKLEELLRPEYTLTVPSAGQVGLTDRATWLKNAVTTYVIHDFQFHELEVREYGDTAVVSSRYTQKATINGRYRSSESFLIDVWVKTGDKWQVSARFSNRQPPATTQTSVTPALK